MSPRRRLAARLAARLAVRLAVTALVPMAGAALLSADAGAQAQDGCSDFSVLGAADGVRVVGSAPGLVLTDADGAGPAAQSLVDSLGQSIGYAGAPYSEAAVGNAGAGGADANDVPVFATSSYPAQPSAGSSSPALTLEATSEARASQARAVAGGTGSDDATGGRSTATSRASCGDDGTVEAVAESLVEVAEFSGVLRIGSVRSTASATIGADGSVALAAATVLEGVTVLGQAVGFSDEGLVLGESASPLPANPLADALADAGISVRVIDGVEDSENGEVLAPAVEVVVTRGVDGFGTGPTRTTYTFGRSFARAATLPAGPATVRAPARAPAPSASGGVVVAPAPTGGTAAPVASPIAVPPSRTAAAPPAPGSGAVAAGPAVAPSLIADVSLASVYPALVAGAAVLGAAWIVFRTMGVKLRWR